MPHIQIRNVPENVHTELVRRAERRGQSLQQYLLDELTRMTDHADIDELIEKLDSMTHEVGFTMQDTVDAIRADRDSR
jgi:plasmid stability protein